MAAWLAIAYGGLWGEASLIGESSSFKWWPFRGNGASF